MITDFRKTADQTLTRIHEESIARQAILRNEITRHKKQDIGWQILLGVAAALCLVGGLYLLGVL